MTKEEVLDIFKKADAYLEGHFILTSGFHSPNYFQKNKVFQFPEFTEKLAKAIADNFRHKKIDVVCSPAVGAIILGYETARQLGVRFVFAERENGIFNLRRGFEFKNDENVLIVEDIITTGGSVVELIECLTNYPVILSGIGCVIDRSEGSAQFEIEMKALAVVDVVKFKPEEVPDWLSKIPVSSPGSKYIKN
ncbi:orotate phosphoribosyltransferase [soil metagenome]